MKPRKTPSNQRESFRSPSRQAALPRSPVHVHIPIEGRDNEEQQQGENTSEDDDQELGPQVERRRHGVVRRSLFQPRERSLAIDMLNV